MLALHLQPDVVLLDYHVRDEIGTSLIADLRALDPSPHVLMLSATEEAHAVVDALESGASGWVVKGARVEVLTNAIAEVQQGRMYLSSATVRPVVERLLTLSRPVRQPSFLDDLTERQVEVLRCLVSGMTRAETAQRLYITTNTVPRTPRCCCAPPTSTARWPWSPRPAGSASSASTTPTRSPRPRPDDVAPVTPACGLDAANRS